MKFREGDKLLCYDIESGKPDKSRILTYYFVKKDKENGICLTLDVDYFKCDHADQCGHLNHFDWTNFPLDFLHENISETERKKKKFEKEFLKRIK